MYCCCAHNSRRHVFKTDLQHRTAFNQVALRDLSSRSLFYVGNKWLKSNEKFNPSAYAKNKIWVHFNLHEHSHAHSMSISSSTRGGQLAPAVFWLPGSGVFRESEAGRYLFTFPCPIVHLHLRWYLPAFGRMNTPGPGNQHWVETWKTSRAAGFEQQNYPLYPLLRWLLGNT